MMWCSVLCCGRKATEGLYLGCTFPGPANVDRHPITRGVLWPLQVDDGHR